MQARSDAVAARAEVPALRAELAYERDELTIARTEVNGLRRELMTALQVQRQSPLPLAPHHGCAAPDADRQHVPVARSLRSLLMLHDYTVS